ncbi:Uncharacterised protein [Burkholderia cepacia]|uniref:Uncharacterized protein n=1 Tax=Burkholderia cepacia TaxID=292 RepID=A0AAE8NJ71_BURCE|nr:Uncharacterised protein [Burkholderia cepacia]
MRDDAFRRDEPAREQVDRDRVAVWPQVRAAHVELLAVADDRPVDGRILAEHAEFDEAAELADQVEPLAHADRHAGRLDVDVAAVAVGERPDDRARIVALRVDRHVGAVLPREFEPLVDQVDHDEFLRRLQVRDLRHHQAERARSGDHDHIVELQVAAVHRMDRARQRLDDRGVFERHSERDPVDDRGGRNAHVFGHPAVGHLALEAEDVVHFAHPVLARPAITALAARHDLLGDHAVAQRHAEMLGRAVAERFDMAEKFMAGNHGRLHPRARAAPEHLRARIALAVARANPARGDADHELVRAGVRLRDLFDAVVLGAVANDRGHPRLGFGCRHELSLSLMIRISDRSHVTATVRG